MLLMRPMQMLSAFVVLAGASAAASAQRLPNSPNPQQRPTPENKPDGVAEAAPKEKAGKLPTVPTLPPAKAGNQFELFELNGYFRWRGDWLKDFDLGFSDDPADGGAPFPNPLGCHVDAGDCDDSISSSNIRLRLEPIINLGELGGTTRSSSVHMQIDVLDNLVLGSTPDNFVGDGTSPSGDTELGAFSRGQAPPQAGRNSGTDSIVVRRAWAEIWTPFGEIKVGRQPSHWGLGVMTNAGGHDPVHGEYDLDSDYGDSVDRLMISRNIPGTRLRGAIGTDWASTQPAAGQIDILAAQAAGQPFDLDDNDDVSQWMLAISRVDAPEVFNDIVADGEVALNYGAYFLYRTQEFAHRGTTVGAAPTFDGLFKRDLTAYLPSVWLRFGYGDFDFEAEATAILGDANLGDLGDAGTTELRVDIRSFGGVGRMGYKVLDGDLRIGFEAGFASGDQFDNPVPGRTNVMNGQVVPTPVMGEVVPTRTEDDPITAFRFNPEYNIDLILFRELLGTVTNATYLRPTVQYNITDGLRIKGQTVVSFAHVPVSTPGNDDMYGVEFDADIGYQNGGFYTGIAYGALFPFGALDHHAAGNAGGPGFGFPADPTRTGRKSVGDGNTAQTLQFRLMLKF